MELSGKIPSKYIAVLLSRQEKPTVKILVEAEIFLCYKLRAKKIFVAWPKGATDGTILCRAHKMG